MPGVQIFHRTISFASDDFFPFGLLHFFLNSITLGLSIYTFTLDTFILLQLILSLLDMILDLLIMFISLQGTIANPKPRKHFSKLLYVSILLLILQLVNTVYGMTLHYTIIVYWNFSVVLLGLLFYLIMLVSSLPVKMDKPIHIQRALQPLFWSAAYVNRHHHIHPKQILKEVAGILTDLFGSLEYCVSDVLAGLILVRKRQVYESSSDEIYSREIHESSVGSGTDSKYGTGADSIKYGPASIDSYAKTIRNIHRIAYLSQYAEAMYGIPLYVFADFNRGFRYLCCPTMRTNSHPNGLNGLTAVGALQRSMSGCSFLLCCFPGSYVKHQHPDLVYASLNGRLFKSPFAVSIDHSIRTIVVAIRGTLSTTDLLIDLYVKEKPISFEWNGKSVNGTTHHGMFEIANTIYEEMVDQRVFEMMNPDYEIVCTGHSLGGAVASLLAFMIKTRQEGLNSRTVAVCYSPPACIVSKEAIPFFSTFCTSVVLGDDFICRLNTRNVHILRDRIDAELKNCHVKKFELISSGIIDRLFRRGYRNVSDPIGDIPEPKVEPLYLPGNVLHFIKMVQGTEEVYQPFWVHPSSLNEIIVSTAMAIDHLPNRVGNVLRSFLPDEVVY